jgi:predicted anti-sigma-YlaC factor YlaD
MTAAADAHARIRETFSAYLEEDLAGEQKKAVEVHLQDCHQCRDELERFRATLGRLGGLRETAPRNFLPGIQRQIYERSRGRFFARRWLLFGRIPFEWVSLVMIIAMLVYYILSLQSAPTEVTPGL